MPFSHGVNGQGLAKIEDYRTALSCATETGDFIGSRPDLYPFDFGIYARYQKDLESRIGLRNPTRSTLEISQLEDFIRQSTGEYKVKWLKEVVFPPGDINSSTLMP